MKKTLMSLAALMMLMTAPVMTSCSNDLDETVPAEEQGNVVTLTIAPPTAEAETRVAMNDQLQITGWEVGDKVNLYRVDWTTEEFYYSDSGVEFTCIDASAGTFSGTMPEGQYLDEFNLAVYGATASKIDDNITLTPTTYSSDKLKDVVVMVAKKSGEGTYQMKIANNVLKVTNTGSDVEVAWTGKDTNGTDVDFFKPLIEYEYNSGSWPGYYLDELPEDCKGWNNVPHFTLAGSNKVTYLTMSQASYNSKYNYIEYWGLAKQDGTEVLAKKSMTGKGYDYKTGTGVTGKVWTVTVGQAATDANLLAGVFSVSANKKVQFTKGNLWCNTTISPVTYAFETNQYDYPVATDYTSDGTFTGWLGTHVGHFFWTTAAAASYAQKYDVNAFLTYNDGVNKTSDKFWLDGSDSSHKLTVSGTSDLYVLSSAEWTYLLETRDNASSLYNSSVTVAGKTGCLIIAPDNYTGSIATEYDAAAWATAEAAGLVCLPFAGYRDNNNPFVAGTSGDYWTSMPDASNANQAIKISFIPEGAYPELPIGREYGFPLRLVKTAQ